ncbi:lytic polysaccharide monooxygenase auxiliary activity family 9 protein [Allonocardiopsis opalescens]|uniref:Chitin binding protein n=1 Tax=Allonocardiopsis opalescens TaxID=1144618 RepID=A0A2T0Q311_9ACTN|nr:lytic polysaccharide monooxygenase auxiliary activity family 9 protein [Allonocardiopsis opalescens]PRX98173.1 chitin binding protein [Allonocardiopsis opalescens]
MNPKTQELVAPHSLGAAAAHRTDGDTTLYGVQLQWTVGDNRGGEWPPPSDWNDGRPPYPHHYEVWIDGGAIKQTVGLHWPGWAPGWQLARTHWVCLGTDPAPEYRVKIRARLGDGMWTDFTNETAVHLAESGPYPSLAPDQSARGDGIGVSGVRHGSVGHPASRAVRAIRDREPADICRRARELNTSTTWQEVMPPAAAMIADPPWNGSYLEYRKFFRGGDVASAGNPAFAGLDLAGDWPTTALPAAAREYTFGYDYTAHHVDATWTHQWFITKQGWRPDRGLSWDDLDPVPFMTETHGDAAITDYTTEALPFRTGRHAIVNVWGGHGGPADDTGRLVGEFFVSCSDVTFT